MVVGIIFVTFFDEVGEERPRTTNAAKYSKYNANHLSAGTEKTYFLCLLGRIWGVGFGRAS